ncbi:DUF916 domain-containing protein [Patescibacteria group bacterium]|nr:DUF916 domain-containing protein [Patescibacteria group bacterium]
MKRRLFISFFGLLAMLAFLPRGVDALTISPPYFDYSLNPGDTVLDVIKLFNESETGAETYYPTVMNFGADEDESGSPQFYPPEEDQLGRGLAQWITVDTSPITIGPQERANLQFSINVPKGADVQPGGHYGAILMSTSPPSVEGNGVGVASQLSSIMLVRVSGEVREVGGVAEFGFVDPQVWYNHLPIDFLLRFENSGNVHLRPTGNLLIKNWYGRTVESLRVNPEFKSVLPMSIRKLTFGWVKASEDSLSRASALEKELKNFALGKYTAQLVLNYGSTNQVLTATRVFYVWPWRLMAIFGGGLLILLLGFWNFKRNYDKSLLRRFERMKKQVDQSKKTEDKE